MADDVVVGTRLSNYSTFTNGKFSIQTDAGPDIINLLLRYGSGGLEQDDMKFYLVKGSLDCSAEQIIYENVIPSSVVHAASICHREPHCTAFTFEDSSRKTMFCQGYRTLSSSITENVWLSAFKPGYENYRGEKAFSEAADSKIPEPSLLKCPSSLTAIPVNAPSTVTLPKQVACDECVPDGICSTMLYKDPFTADQSLSFDSSLQAAKDYVLRRIKVNTSAFKGINPSIFAVGSKEFVTFRATSATRCYGTSVAGTWETDATLLKYHSYVVVCELSPSNRLILKKSCFVVHAPGNTREISNIKYLYKLSDKTEFVGLEDPRGFSSSGKMFILCNVGIDIHSKDIFFKKRFPNGRSVRQMLLIAVNRRAASRYMLISLPDSGSHRANEGDVKNVMPLVGVGLEETFLVYSVDPLLICSLNIRSGTCSRVGNAIAPLQYSKDSRYTGRWSGSTPFVKTSGGYIALVHRKQSLTLGRFYTHKWLLLEETPPFRQIWSSASFRLPSPHRAGYSDIQFAAGVLIDKPSHSAFVSYGVGDCVSLIGQFDLPSMSNFSVVGSVPSFILRHVSENTLRVKWEGPFSDNSGFASAARQLWTDPALHKQADVRFLDTSRSPRRDQVTLEPMLKEKIIFSHLGDHLRPDITIRFSWPLNFNPVHAGKLVLYFPWEFYSIPESWVNMINTNVDEVWTPSEWCKRGFQASGVLRDVYVIPHGSPEKYCGKSIALGLRRTSRRFFAAGKNTLKLLYHGGALWRKGIDLTLQAYLIAFGPSDDVLLTIHFVYGDVEVITFVKKFLREHAGQLAKVNLLTRELSDQELTLLYVESDMLLHLSRSEGFGLSILEAMSLGTPVMVSDSEPMSDFVSPANGFLIPAKKTPCDKFPCLRGGERIFFQDLPVADELSWQEIDVIFTSRIIRDIFADRNLIEVRRQAARETACSAWSWNLARSLVSQRLTSLGVHIKLRS